MSDEDYQEPDNPERERKERQMRHERSRRKRHISETERDEDRFDDIFRAFEQDLSNQD